MFKTGIYKLEQLKNLKTIFGNEKKISITLYNELVQNNYDSTIAEKILFDFTDDKGTFKRTYTNRFEEFDKCVASIIIKHFPLQESLIVHDTAVSDGRTACDFFHLLKEYYPEITYYASDYDPYIFVIEDNNLKLVLNAKNIPLEIVYPPFVLNLVKASLKYPINNFISFILKKTVIKNILSKYKKNQLLPKKNIIFSPETLLLASHNSRFKLIQHNLLESFNKCKKLNIIRAMNILNEQYFHKKQFEYIIRDFFKSLGTEGIFITGSNQNSHTIVDGGVFIKTNNCFKLLFSSGQGSFVEKLILNYKD